MNEGTKIKCPYCGAWVDSVVDTCPQCCAPLKPAQAVQAQAAPEKKEGKQLPPTAIAALVCGILSVNFCILVIPGFILSGIGKRKAQEGYEALAAHPELYTGQGILNAARITSKFGFIFSFVGIAYWIFYGLYFAALFSDL